MYYSRRIVALVATIVIIAVIGAVVVLRSTGSPQANQTQGAPTTVVTNASRSNRSVTAVADLLASRLSIALQAEGTYDAALASRTIQVWSSALADAGASASFSRATRTVVVGNRTECVSIKIAASGRASASKPMAC